MLNIPDFTGASEQRFVTRGPDEALGSFFFFFSRARPALHLYAGLTVQPVTYISTVIQTE